MWEPLGAESLRRVLGPVTPGVVGDVETVGEAKRDGYVLRHVSYPVPSGRASVFVCIPDSLDGPAPLVFCHHQHAGRFDRGKSEVVGLRGDEDQRYAAELAQRGFVTVAPDATRSGLKTATGPTGPTSAGSSWLRDWCAGGRSWRICCTR